MSIQNASSNFRNKKYHFNKGSIFGSFSNFAEDEKGTIEIKNYKSVNYQALEFINYLPVEGKKEIKDLLLMLKEAVGKTAKFLEKSFEVKELREEKTNTDRVLQIINNQSDEKIEDITELIKYKHKKEKEFQLYIRLDDNILNVYLIDLYHLGLPGDLRVQDGKKIIPYDRSKIYNKNNKPSRNLCINSILKIISSN